MAEAGQCPLGASNGMPTTAGLAFGMSTLHNGHLAAAMMSCLPCALKNCADAFPRQYISRTCGIVISRSVNFPRNIYNRYTVAFSLERGIGCFCKDNVWFISYLNHSDIVSISCYRGPCFNGTWLHLRTDIAYCTAFAHRLTSLWNA